MKKKIELPDKISVLPLSNFIIFPETTVPLNIFEPRYIEMIDDSMNGTKMIGMIQPKKISYNSIPELYDIGCVGKITNFNKTNDGRYIISLNGLSRFKIIEEVKNNKLYRECKISFNDFKDDIITNDKNLIKFSDLDLIFKNLKTLFSKKGYLVNWKEIEKQDLNQTINALAMASPFSLEEKQVLLETKNLNMRKDKLVEILNTYVLDEFNNTTVQ
jgi:Lon protease-like protein